MTIRHLLSEKDYNKEEILKILDLATELKLKQKRGEDHAILKNKTLALIFQKPSTRTRVSFEVGMFQLGGKTIDVKQAEIGMGERESVADVSRVMSRYVDAVMIRPFYHSDVVEFAKYSSVPVINGLSDLYHPCQAFADMLTVKEHKGLKNIKFVYVGDGNNVCQSLCNITKTLGIEMVVACPKGREPSMDSDIAEYKIEYDPFKAVKNADVVYTDVWQSMGPAGQDQIDRDDFKNYTVSSELMALAKADAIFMHCLPAHRGEEVDHDVLESKNSVVFDQAENRMHAQKAILVSLLK